MYSDKKNSTEKETAFVSPSGIRAKSLSPAYQDAVSIQPESIDTVMMEKKGTRTLDIT